MDTMAPEAPVGTPTDALSEVTYRGERFEPGTLGLMGDCTSLLGNPEALRDQMRRQGYVYLPGFLGRERVTAARQTFIAELLKLNALDPRFDPMEGVLCKPFKAPGFAGGVLKRLFPAPGWQRVHQVLYEGPMIEFFGNFLGTPVRHYDFTWTRQVNPGLAAAAHSDVVYMGRGTHELFTAWTPMGDNGFDLGGLMVLEGSNNHAGLAKSYWQNDVDSYCTNKPDARAWGKSWGTEGSLKGSAAQLRKSLRHGRWLTGNFRMGDVVIFNVYTVHGGTDNRSGKVRLSTDTRYQRADQPVDERWVGEDPVGHSSAGKRGRVC